MSLPIPGTVRIPELGQVFRAEIVANPEDAERSGRTRAGFCRW